MKKKVFVGFSGGVDSSVAALLLKQQGYDVKGIYLKNWSGEDFGIDELCPWKEDLEYVEKVAQQIGIPYETYNFESIYRELVIKNFYEEYERGNTPNPDILCNKFIKFDAFLNKALKDGADLIATGHYAITDDGKLSKGKDKNKDQSYFLAGLSKAQLQQSLFPIGHLHKSDVRDIATKAGLYSAKRKDSQGICFVGKVDIQEFLSQKLKKKIGDIIDLDTNKKLGKHDGVWFYTNGQRKGLRIGGSDKPYFVVSKDVSKNILYVAKGRDNPLLWSHMIPIEKPVSIDTQDVIEGQKDLEATIRYRGKLSEVILKQDEKGFTAHFTQPQWAPAPGQSVVFYKNDRCLGLAKVI